MIKLVGFKVSAGAFTPDNSDNAINYDNRVLVCLTDEGLPAETYGCIAFEQKIKAKSLAKTFNCRVDDVNDTLYSEIGSEIELCYVPVNGRIECTGYRVIKSSEEV